MFRYAFYRIYKHYCGIGDIDPKISAAMGWGLYVGAVYVPFLVVVLKQKWSWIPQRFIAHPAWTAIAIGWVFIGGAYIAWVRSGVYATLGELYEAESSRLKRIRTVLFWAWPAVGLLIFIAIACVGFGLI